jgi:hypothetical protein
MEMDDDAREAETGSPPWEFTGLVSWALWYQVNHPPKEPITDKFTAFEAVEYILDWVKDNPEKTLWN